VSDTREDILTRVEALLGDVGLNVYRDRGELERGSLPAIVLLDGREVIISEIANRKTVKMPAALFKMSVQVWLSLLPRDDVTNATLGGVAAPIGPELSRYRVLILNAVLNDDVLTSILTTTGQMEYRGCETDMAVGSSMVGQMMLSFDFTYVLFPPKA
jgi:hypothetical protein